jgi:DNA-binding NarL/FixJ family response regulator
LFRNGLVLLLTSLDIEITAECGSADDLMCQLSSDVPDAVILDMRMPPTFTDEGLAAATRLRIEHPGVGVLVLSTYAETAYAISLLSPGASGVGYLLKDRVANGPSLKDALRRVSVGECVVDPEIVDRLIHRRQGSLTMARLSDRERDVVRLMAEGRSNAGISKALFLGERTVETHVASIFSKLDLVAHPHTNRRVQAVIEWLRAT